MARHAELRGHLLDLSIYPPFWPAIRHNLIWLAFFLVIPTTFGLFLAVLLDRNLRGSRVYQSALFLPVILSLALVGFIWQLVYAPEQGLINNILGRTEEGRAIDWLGNPSLNLWAVLVAASWRHVGYIMVLYLAGLKSVDPSLREAAKLDGATEVQTFRHVVFPVLKPVNIIVLVVTVIESLRAFDIVFIINRGSNGLELLSVLVYNNIVGEASRIGYGSALAVILLVVSRGSSCRTCSPRSGRSRRNEQPCRPCGDPAGDCGRGAPPARRARPRGSSSTGSSRSRRSRSWRRCCGRSTRRCVPTRTRPSAATSRRRGQSTSTTSTSALANLEGVYFTNNNLIAAGALLAAIPTVAVYIALQKQFIGGLTLGATKG